MPFDNRELETYFPVVSGECRHCRERDGKTRLICGEIQHVRCFQNDVKSRFTHASDLKDQD